MPTAEQQSSPGLLPEEINHVLAQMREQIGLQSQDIAVKNAIIKTQTDELGRLREVVDELASKVTQTPAPTKRTNAAPNRKKGK